MRPHFKVMLYLVILMIHSSFQLYYTWLSNTRNASCFRAASRKNQTAIWISIIAVDTKLRHILLKHVIKTLWCIFVASPHGRKRTIALTDVKRRLNKHFNETRRQCRLEAKRSKKNTKTELSSITEVEPKSTTIIHTEAITHAVHTDRSLAKTTYTKAKVNENYFYNDQRTMCSD